MVATRVLRRVIFYRKSLYNILFSKYNFESNIKLSAQYFSKDFNTKLKSFEAVNSKKSLDYDDLCEELGKPHVLFDVRTVEEVNKSGCIPGAINIPCKLSVIYSYFSMRT